MGDSMSKVAYLRVSTTEQNLASQEDALAAHGPFDQTFAEKLSGLDQDRPKLKECLRYLRKGGPTFWTAL